MFTWMPGLTIAEIEKQSILQAMQFYHGNKTVAAKSLGIALRTLYDKLGQYELEEKIKEDKKASLQKTNEDLLKRARGSFDAVAQGLAPRIGDNPHEIRARVRVESAQNNVESPVSLPKQEDVLPVLPEQAPRRDTGKQAKRN